MKIFVFCFFFELWTIFSLDSLIWVEIISSNDSLTVLLSVFLTESSYLTILLSLFKQASTLYTLHKKWSFPLRICSVNVTKSVGNCVFGHIYWRNRYWKTFFVCSDNDDWRANFSMILFSPLYFRYVKIIIEMTLPVSINKS